MPADIFIAYKEGQMELESEHNTTIADIIRNRGPGSLRREDGVMILSPSFVIKAGNYSWIPAQQSEQENGRLPNDCNGLLRLKAEKKDAIANNKSVHSEPNERHHYVERAEEWKQVERLLECLGGSLDGLKNMIIERKKMFTLEYATISGAGKSRFVMHEFGKEKFKEIPMSLVGLNFIGGTGGGSDTDSIIQTILEGKVDVAMSRLLLSRGFFGVHPTMKIFSNHVPLTDPSLPTVQVVIEALFQDRFREHPVGEGLLVVHLDELWKLKKRLHEKLSWDPNITAKERKGTVDGLVKSFISILLEYSLDKSAQGRYILPVVSHTCPDNDLLQNRKQDQTLYSPTGFHLFPFSLEQSIELLRRRRQELSQPSRKRKLEGKGIRDEWEEINWEELKNVIALAGGHPSLLLNCFPALEQPLGVSLQTTSEGSMMSNLMTNNRVNSFARTVEELANEARTDENAKGCIERFLTDCLLRKVVAADEHETILGRGAGWFQPLADKHTGDLKSSDGLVSAPFPIMVLLMRACPSFNEIGAALDPRGKDYAPTKAMEFVSALAVLLRRTQSVDSWKTFTTGEAFDKVETEKQNFFSVWPIRNQKVVDFGGKINDWKLYGQSKMQEPGKHSTQSLKDVMEMAWKIGRRVRMGQLTGKVHAYWVSSRKAPSQKALKLLVHAFRVAMSGTITKETAETEISKLPGPENAGLENLEGLVEAAVAEGMMGNGKKRAMDVRIFINYLDRKDVNDDYAFTYIGTDCQADGDCVIPLSDLLPKGIFAGWA